MNENDLLSVHNLSKAYRPGVYAPADVSFAIEKGDFVFLTGPSGAGKCTLLPARAPRRRADRGTHHRGRPEPVANEQAADPGYRRSVGFVFQDFKLIARKSVYDNIALLPRLLGVPETQLRRRVTQVLNEVGLSGRLNDRPPELSGGEQRVAIARALVNEPTLILADEPTGNLDPVLSLEVMTLFRTINASGTTALVATHDRALIRHMGRRVITLDHGHVGETA